MKLNLQNIWPEARNILDRTVSKPGSNISIHVWHLTKMNAYHLNFNVGIFININSSGPTNKLCHW